MNDNDDLMTDLSRTLQDQAHSMDGTSLGLADVQGRARSIRRRRTAAGVVGAVAAVALIVPTAALAVHNSDRSNEPLPATNSVSPTPSETTATDPAPGVLDVSDLPTGAGPEMDYLYDGRLYSPDGSVGDVGTRYPPHGFVELADGARVWQTDDQGTPYVEIQDADGTFHDPVQSNWGLSVNQPHSIAAWLTPDGQVTIWEGWASEPRPLGDPVPGSDLRLGPVTGSGQAAPGQPGPDCAASTCTVIVNVHGSSPNQPWEVGESGSQPLTDGGYLDVNDVNESGLTIGFTKITDFRTCSKLLGGGEFQGFGTCRHQLSSFSPDGRLIQALPSYFDGVGPGGIGMYDLEGTLLFERNSNQKTQAFLSEATWEDDTHLLAPMFQDGKWAIVRVASDGSMEYAVAPVKGPYDRSPFVLPTGGALPAG
jgi:hypothetical protein